MLTRLTALWLSVPTPIAGWCTGARCNAWWRSGTFLTGLTGLVYLELRNVLHPLNTKTDVRCIAALTRLTCLGLGGEFDHRRMQFSPCPILDFALRCSGKHPSRTLPRAFTAFEHEGGFRELTRLRRLRKLYCDGPWECLQQSSLLEGLNAGQLELGWPPLICSARDTRWRRGTLDMGDTS